MWQSCASASLLVLAALAGARFARASDAGPPTVLWLEVTGTIDPAVDDYLDEAFEKAQARGVEAVIIQLDTPGGLVSTTRAIIARELNAPLPVVVWVGPAGARAASAGVFVTMAAHVAVMAPGTHIGAATPVMIGAPGGGGRGGEPSERKDGEAPEDAARRDPMHRKIMEDTRAFARAIAERRGRPADWIEGTVTSAKSHTAKEALAAGAIDLLADGRRELLAALDGREVVVHGETHTLRTRDAAIDVLDMRLGQAILHALADPSIAYLLLMLGVLLVYVELSAPGGYIAGGLGAVAIVLAVISLQILPFDAGGLVLTLLGIGLLIAEHFLPTLGILGITGVVALVIGGLMLFDTDELTVRMPAWFVVVTAAIFGAGALTAGLLVARAHRKGPAVGAETMVGGRGEVMAALEPIGQVRVRGELWRAELEDGGRLGAGRRVEVTGVDGLRLKVRPAPDAAGDTDRTRQEEP